jgi:uncharacterized membrane protein YqiK
MLEFVTAPENLPFSVALLLMLMIGAVEAVGLGAGAAHLEIDADADGGSLLGWLGVGQVPFLILLVVLLALFGMIGITLQQIVSALAGVPLAPWNAAAISFVASLPLLGVCARGLSRIVPQDETTAIPLDHLVGKRATVTVGAAKRGSPAPGARARYPWPKPLRHGRTQQRRRDGRRGRDRPPRPPRGEISLSASSKGMRSCRASTTGRHSYVEETEMPLMTLAIYAASSLRLLIILGLIVTRPLPRATKEIGFVRTGFGGEKVVINGGAMVLPVLHETMPVNLNTVRLAVERKNTDALITLDRLRIDVKAEFYVRVRPDRESIATAAQTLGLRTMQPEHLKELIEGKFVDALRSVAAGMTMNQLHEQRSEFVQKVQQVSSADLAMNGLELESVSLTGLDQTSIDHFNANNAFDAEGLTKLTEQIELRRKARNDIEQETRVQIEAKNLEAARKSFEISRDTEFARLEQEREVEVRRAAQNAEVAQEQSERQREADEARITAKRQVDSAQIEANKVVEQAKIAQTQAIEIARQEQQIAVQNKSREESQAKAEADTARAAAVAAEERVGTARETEVAERVKRIELIDASREAERSAIGIRVQADAEKQAAADRAEALRLGAEGEAEAEKLRAEASRVRFEVEATGQRAVNEAANLLSSDQISLQTKLALLKVLPEVIREAAKPLEAIDSIKIIQVDGLTGNGGGAGAGAANDMGGGERNLANSAVAAALRYRAQAPIVDGLMKELGFDGSTLDIWWRARSRRTERCRIWRRSRSSPDPPSGYLVEKPASTSQSHLPAVSAVISPTSSEGSNSVRSTSFTLRSAASKRAASKNISTGIPPGRAPGAPGHCERSITSMSKSTMIAGQWARRARAPSSTDAIPRRFTSDMVITPMPASSAVACIRAVLAKGEMPIWQMFEPGSPSSSSARIGLPFKSPPPFPKIEVRVEVIRPTRSAEPSPCAAGRVTHCAAQQDGEPMRLECARRSRIGSKASRA